MRAWMQHRFKRAAACSGAVEERFRGGLCHDCGHCLTAYAGQVMASARQLGRMFCAQHAHSWGKMASTGCLWHCTPSWGNKDPPVSSMSRLVWPVAAPFLGCASTHLGENRDSPLVPSTLFWANRPALPWLRLVLAGYWAALRSICICWMPRHPARHPASGPSSPVCRQADSRLCEGAFEGTCVRTMLRVFQTDQACSGSWTCRVQHCLL